MNFDFPLVLLILSAVTGAIYLVDYFVLSKSRDKQLSQFLAERRVSDEDFRHYIKNADERTSLENEGAEDKSAKPDPQRTIIFKQASTICQEPIPVEYAKAFFPILFAVLILRSFLLEPFQIPSTSMVPTLHVGDFIVVNKFAYGLRLPVIGTKILNVADPKRGDVMVFIPPHDPRYFIKRVIGLPGDHVRYADNIVYINGEAQAQETVSIIKEQGIKFSIETIDGLPHSIHNDTPQRPASTYEWLDDAENIRSGWLRPEGMVVPEGQYFMMGDNRDASQDSRYWGPASEAQIVGKAVAVWMHKEPGFHLPTFGQNRLIENAH